MIGATSRATEGFAPELFAVALYKGESPQEDLGDDAAGVVSSGDFGGQVGETALLYGQESPAPRLLLVGLGDRDNVTPEKLRRAAATVARRARTLKLRETALSLPTLPETGTRDVARAAAEGAKLGLYRFDRHKTAAKSHEVDAFWLVSDEEALEEAREGAELGDRVADGAVLARDLANEPSNVATPEYLAEKAHGISEKHGMNLTVLDRAGIEEEGLTGLATVGRSASNEPRFIVLEHR
ncbi:MAG TPA: M17 family peptidase N-terminal domain-containing protein, partial [Rubrobacter sp.]|nr:M17 family peptidase N-terminal domain-containing protein [Rubrobacter sp.]